MPNPGQPVFDLACRHVTVAKRSFVAFQDLFLSSRCHFSLFCAFQINVSLVICLFHSSQASECDDCRLSLGTHGEYCALDAS